jgi:poly(hydroxyalkanoate) depolymerase family esterase
MKMGPMNRLIRMIAGAAFAAGALAARSADAASLQQVNNWKGTVSGLPSDVSMFAYVPDKVATNPPILVLVHYCGGTASAVFGQASGGGIVKAADQYGFIMVVPSSGRCWDVVSDKTRTRNGGGDSHAIVQMVRFAVTQYSANSERVYSTGDSSGGMMTELLLALYPDIFKAGAAFAGMPAGCRGANESGAGGGYSGACAGGSVTHTPEQWGDIARMMAPNYMGHRPRVQLFHGDADTTIRYANFTEAIKQWTNVLGIGATPTSMQSLQLGTHQAKRQTWQNSCGYPVLDGFTSIGGDHGPSDALFPAQYVIPFLGLDKVGATDPEIAQCGGGTGGGASGGSTGAGGASHSGGANSGGTNSGGTNSGGRNSGGALGSGGRASGGEVGSGAGGGGAMNQAGTLGGGGTSGASSNGGATGGSVAAGASSAAGATSGGAGTAPGSGGAGMTEAKGGARSTSGGIAGSSDRAGASTGGEGSQSDSSGCSCAVAGGGKPRTGLFGLLFAVGLAGLRNQSARERRSARRSRESTR